MSEDPLVPSSLEAFATDRLRSLARRSLRRQITTTDRGRAPVAQRNGRELLSFACNDYLGLSTHPAVVAAGIEALRRYGAGAGGSRLITGSHPLYEQLERQLAALKGTEAAIVFGSGYLANVGTLPVLAGPKDLILVDELSHSCIGSGAALSRARVLAFRHNETSSAAALLEQHRSAHRHCLLVTESVFSMDGDVAPVAELAALAERYDAWLMTDDAHGLGVSAPHGAAAPGRPEGPAVPLQMGTLSKAVGGYGGYVCAGSAVTDLLRNRARTFVYSTGLPPAVVAAATAALTIIAEDRALMSLPLRRARLFTELLGLPQAQSAVVPLVVGTVERALAAAASLEQRGLLVAAIRPPTVPAGTSRLRFAFSAQHSEEDVRRLATAVAESIDGINLPAHRGHAAPARGLVVT